jgi:hypothetical protein
MKRAVLAIISVFVVWSILDFIIHGLILSATYQATAALWRPMQEMKIGLLYFTVFVSSMVFVFIYARFIAEKGIGTAVKFGLLFGLGVGVSMGYGSYAVMPIPYKMALVWFLGTVVETTLGGLLLGLIIRE